MKFKDAFLGLFGKGDKINIRIMQKIRLPRILAAVLCGIGLSISGLIMQTCLNNPMASPMTLGVSNASVLGANVAIIMLSGGKVSTNNNANWNVFNPYAVSSIAFLFSLGAIFLILIIAKTKNFSPETLVLSGLSLSSLFTAITTLLQYFATDTQLSSAVYWSFGDLGRVGYKEIVIMLFAIFISYIVFTLYTNQLNALCLGDDIAKTTGVNTEMLRFILLGLSSLITATCISFLGVISFLGLICPHVARKIFSSNHKYLLPSSALFGSILLLLSDDVSRSLLKGFSLPVGALTAILGAPFFLAIIFSYERGKRHA